ncbi:interferon-induced protein with tetratricopeptide repeats 2-like [Boleophthalmus pectinirostris]|uniref:interferon-induced protein with tetratricopeptide repeats 2-like n=1 Tax=Boleophthalmus pectinirostris TaxID=150288 RepID=UPI00242D6BD1|nr:interferon-induced protein with tetratricopeptide repeats 2-like [Boleophthalmus pectinirostris]
MEPLEELQCHFTWELKRSRFILFSLRDRLEDLAPEESATWRGQNYNLQGFLQHRLGRSSEALSFLRSASEALRGPGLLVNYSDLAWLHHERGAHEQSQEYLSRVEALRREYPTEGEHPEVLAEKAFSLMEFYNDKKLLAAELLDEALRQQPERREWLSAQAVVLVSAHRHSDDVDEKVLLKIKRAMDRDPENLQLQAEYLNLRVQKEESEQSAHRGGQSAHRGGQSAHRGEQSAHRGGQSAHRGGQSAHRGGQSAHRGGRGWGTGEELRAEVSALASQLLQKPQTLLRDIKCVLELQRRAGRVDEAVALANAALRKRPDSRYLKASLAECLKWQLDQQGERASQELMEQAAELLGEVASLYPESCLRTELDRANVYAKSNRGLAQAQRLYQDLLLRDLETVSRQMVLNQYAKFLKHERHDYVKSMEYHMRAAEIPSPSFYRTNSITVLRRLSPRDERLRRRLQLFLRDLQDS